MRLQLLIYLSFIVCACNHNKKAIAIQTNGKIVLIDSSGQTGNLLAYNPTYRMGYYPIYYIGKAIDTIRIGRELERGCRKGQKDYDDFKNFTWADSSKMKIVVDTNFSSTHTVCNWNDNNGEQFIDSTETFKAIPVFIYNFSDSLLSVGIFSELGYTVRQAKNCYGKWLNIEVPIKYFCGTGAAHNVIEPRQMLVAKLLRYRGDYRTECRLKFARWNYTVYSNSFVDYVDKKQLLDELK